MTEPVALESILPCFGGLIPSPFATCSADGTPNVTYLSIVQYVDAERVALSRQFFNKTRANLDANPQGQVLVVDPGSLQQFRLDLAYLHTEADGPTFDAMKTNLDAIASQTGATGLFRLRGVDIHRVLRCEQVGEARAAAAPRSERDVVARLDELTRRLALHADYGEAARGALEALDDLFDMPHAILLVRAPAEERLFAVASNGYGASAAGAEIALGVGVIGVAAERAQVVCVPNLARSRVMQAAIRSSLDADPGGREIALPGLEHAQSVAAVPLAAHGEVLGVLYLEHEQAGAFGPHNERLLRILGRHLAATLRGFGADGSDRGAPAPATAPARLGGEPSRVTYYQADDSVFIDDRYVIKGVAGAILWKLLREHVAEGREAFTNRELRLDERLGLPPGNDNLEARLLVLRKRLAAGAFGIELERTGRGRFALRPTRPLTLAEVATSGPMRAAHTPPPPG